jgi:DNA-binding Lrp family transcriptional regulator
MSAAFTLDRIDRRIVGALQANGRLTNQALSERVALSPSACLARVRRLEREGIIQGYHARLDPFRLDVGLVVFAEVTLKGHGAEELARFDAAIEALPQVVEASHVSGAYDYLLKVVVGDIAEWTRLGEQLSAEAGADRINTHVLLRKAKVFVGYPVKVR